MDLIILRRPVRDQANAVPASPGEGSSIEVARNPSDREIADLNRDPTVVATAPPMPIDLIEPLLAADDAPGAPPRVSWGIAAVRADLSQATGAGVTVAVLDTGIREDHPAFKGHGIAIKTENFTTEEAADTNGHGTHCAGTIFGREVDGCRIGVAPGVARVLAGKVIGRGATTRSLYEAVLWAIKEKAHVVSMSLGLNFVRHREWLKETYGYEEPVLTDMALAHYRDSMELFEKLGDLAATESTLTTGCLIFAATGNESRRPKYHLDAVPPAAADRFISVGALDAAQELAKFSNGGAKFVAPGADIWSADHAGRLKRLSGTSMATPHVAGVAALWTQLISDRNAALTPPRPPPRASQVLAAMQKSSLDLSVTNDPDDVGAGLVQAPVP